MTRQSNQDRNPAIKKKAGFITFGEYLNTFFFEISKKKKIFYYIIQNLRS